MHEVRIKRTDLIETIQSNRTRHIQEFTIANDSWKVQFRAALQREALKVAEADSYSANTRWFDIQKEYPQPIGHVKDYDRVLRMLTMSADEIVTLSADDFNQFVMDEWTWKAAFTTTNSTYFSK
jgi:hypothetical protein